MPTRERKEREVVDAISRRKRPAVPLSDLVDLKLAAARCGVRPAILRAAAHEGRIRAWRRRLKGFGKEGKKLYFHRKDLAEWLERGRVRQAPRRVAAMPDGLPLCLRVLEVELAQEGRWWRRRSKPP